MPIVGACIGGGTRPERRSARAGCSLGSSSGPASTAVRLDLGHRPVDAGMPAPCPEIGPAVHRQPFLRDLWELEEEHVPGLLSVRSRRRRTSPDVPPTARRGARRARRPSTRSPTPPGAPVVTDDVGSLDTGVVEHGHHIADEPVHRVGGDLGGLVRAAISTHVGNDDLESRGGEHRYLMAPEPPQSGNPCSNTTGRPSPDALYSMPTPSMSTRIATSCGWRPGSSPWKPRLCCLCHQALGPVGLRLQPRLAHRFGPRDLRDTFVKPGQSGRSAPPHPFPRRLAVIVALTVPIAIYRGGRRRAGGATFALPHWW